MLGKWQRTTPLVVIFLIGIPRIISFWGMRLRVIVHGPERSISSQSIVVLFPRSRFCRTIGSVRSAGVVSIPQGTNAFRRRWLHSIVLSVIVWGTFEAT